MKFKEPSEEDPVPEEEVAVITTEVEPEAGKGKQTTNEWKQELIEGSYMDRIQFLKS